MIPVDEWISNALTLSVNGSSIAYWTTGEADDDKPWLLLIHGFPTSSWDWSAIWPTLAEQFNLAAIDMLGFGLSDKPKRTVYTMASQADLQEALLAHLGVSEAHILAHDYGDTIAQELMARQQESALSFSIKSVCLLNGGLFPEQHRARLIQKLGVSPLGPVVSAMLSKDKLRTSFDQIFGPHTKASADEIDGHWRLISHKGGRKVFHKLLNYIPERKKYRERWVGALKNASMPVRLINGGADPISGKHLYDYFKQEAPDADAVLLGDIGHYPQTEAPDRVLSAFLDFHQQANRGRQ